MRFANLGKANQVEEPAKMAFGAWKYPWGTPTTREKRVALLLTSTHQLTAFISEMTMHVFSYFFFLFFLKSSRAGTASHFNPIIQCVIWDWAGIIEIYIKDMVVAPNNYKAYNGKKFSFN